jgi:hypothetical protein
MPPRHAATAGEGLTPAVCLGDFLQIGAKQSLGSPRLAAVAARVCLRAGQKRFERYAIRGQTERSPFPAAVMFRVISPRITSGGRPDANHIESIGPLIMWHKGKVGWRGCEIGRLRGAIGTGSELPETYMQFWGNPGGDSLPARRRAARQWPLGRSQIVIRH